ncbi:MAG: DNA repair exonuclease [Acidobacteria bacterium]|nr:DNA repair exonuclease [Acidobacteriota bacterium]
MTEATPFSFLHCADLHLDSPFRGLGETAPTIAKALERASFSALERITALALEHEVDFVVFAGDVYDGTDRSLTAQLRFRDALARLSAAGIESFIAHGNHDPLPSWHRDLELPVGAHRFAGAPLERFVVQRRGRTVAQLHGYSYPQREVRESVVPHFPKRPGPPFAIGVLHANVGGQSGHGGYAPCSVDDLVATGFDYWALGHVHRRQLLYEGGPWVVYPGFTQGRSVRELGAGGCYVVEVDEAGRARPVFAPTDAVRWHRAKITLEPGEPLETLLDRALAEREATRGDERPTILRLEVTGRTDLDGRLRRPEPRRELLEALRDGEEERPDFVWIEGLEVATAPALDLEARRRQEDFAGEVLRRVDELRRHPEAAAELRRRLEARPEARLIRDHLDSLPDDDLVSLLDEVEAATADRLEL